MITWIPDLQAMTNYRIGLSRVFQPYEDLVITMSPDRQNWPMMSQEEIADIGAILDHPWISVGEVIGPEVSEDRIPIFMENLMNPQISTILDHVRPHLVYEGVPQVRVRHRSNPTPVPNRPVPQSLPIHIVKLLLERAEKEGSRCPITEEPLTMATASVTSCGHLFNTSAIRRWLSTAKGCPECRQTCVV
jgi:hypothetical protein